MSQAVLCPQCGKKFGLPERPPATYPCTQCGTVMDLTAFGGVTPRPKTPPKAAGPDRRPPRGTARGPARPQGRARRPSSDGSPMVLMVVGVIILILVILVAVRRGDEDELGPKPTKKDTSIVADTPVYSVPTPRSTEEGEGAGAAHTPKSGVRTGRDGKPRLGNLPLAKHAWPDDVPEETRTRVESSIQTLYRGGRDAVDARTWLTQQEHSICGRLISEFKSIEESPGFDNRDGASMAADIDGTLRAMDGQVERLWEERERIRAWGAFGSPGFITKVARYWTWWWTSGEWRTQPREPWDAHEDEADDTPSGMKPPAEGEKKDGKQGWGKRAGSGD